MTRSRTIIGIPLRALRFAGLVLSVLLLVGTVTWIGGNFLGQTTPQCTDSDGGIDPSVAGLVTVNTPGRSAPDRYHDFCISPFSVAEMGCNSTGGTMDCPSGKRCVAGACR